MTITTTTGEGIAGPNRGRGELLDVKAVAATLDCSTRHIYRLSDGGKMPRPLKLGALVRWRSNEIHDWIAAGCPSVRSLKSSTR